MQVLRLEGQVKRYKASAEQAEANEEDLKAERRKLTREVRYHAQFIKSLCPVCKVSSVVVKLAQSIRHSLSVREVASLSPFISNALVKVECA